MNAARVVREIVSFMEAHSMSQMDLSRRTGIPQATLSRALGNPVRISGTHRKICKFANIPLDGIASAVRTQQALIQAVLSVWDGTPEHAQSIARLLSAGANLEAHASARAAQHKKSDAAR